jgi:hypothetical protein
MATAADDAKRGSGVKAGMTVTHGHGCDCLLVEMPIHEDAIHSRKRVAGLDADL